MLLTWQIPTYFSFGIACMVLNSLEIILIQRKLSKRKSTKSFEIFLLSLSCSDLLIGISTVVVIVYLMADSKSVSGIKASKTWFQTYLIRMTFSISTSISNVLAIGIDRLLAVRYPFEHRTWMSARRAKFIVTGIWTLNIIIVINMKLVKVFNSPKIMLSTRYVSITSTVAFSAGIKFVFLYSSILWTVFKADVKFIDGLQANDRNKRKTVKHRNLAVTCTLIMVAFLVCTFPIIIELITNIGRGRYLPFTLVFTIANTIIDPVIYFFRSYMETGSSKNNPEVPSEPE